MTVAAVWRGGETIAIPKSQLRMRARDELLIIGQETQLDDLLVLRRHAHQRRSAGGPGRGAGWRAAIRCARCWLGADRLRRQRVSSRAGRLALGAGRDHDPVALERHRQDALAQLKFNRDLRHAGGRALARWRRSSTVNVRKEAAASVGDAIRGGRQARGYPAAFARNPNLCSAGARGILGRSAIQNKDKAPVAGHNYGCWRWRWRS